jgi:hypothetical protein
VHRDVKPHNILVTRHAAHEHAYLTDFGLARHLLDTGLTGTGAALGTPAYMAPEQVLGRTLDSRADIYSLGAVLFEAVTGNVPFTAETSQAVLFAHVHEPPPRASAFNTNVPAALDDVLRRALAKEPDNRPPTAGALATEVREALRTKTLPLGPSIDFGKLESPFSLPARVTSAFIQREAPSMTPERFEEFIQALRQRNWTNDDLHERVYPYAPAAWREERGAAAVVVVFESLGAESRTRELLEVLPGGADRGLTPAQLGQRMRPEASGAKLSKASVRAVIRNLQRVENRLLDEHAISRRILGKSFAHYDREQAGRYYLETIDREELDRHLAAQTADAPAELAALEIDHAGRQPVALIPATLVGRVAVEIEGRVHRAAIESGAVVVDGVGRADWMEVNGDIVRVPLGAKVPALLASAERADDRELIAAALIVAAVVGHPRRDPAGQPVSFVWTDHVALAAEGSAATGMRFSWVRDEQAEHVRRLHGRVRRVS